MLHSVSTIIILWSVEIFTAFNTSILDLWKNHAQCFLTVIHCSIKKQAIVSHWNYIWNSFEILHLNYTWNSDKKLHINFTWSFLWNSCEGLLVNLTWWGWLAVNEWIYNLQYMYLIFNTVLTRMIICSNRSVFVPSAEEGNISRSEPASWRRFSGTRSSVTILGLVWYVICFSCLVSVSYWIFSETLWYTSTNV